jgi:ribosomal protein S12 methylthiotransferase
MQAGFDYVGVFVYSAEDGTVAGASTDQVPMRTRKARAQRLRDIADRIGFDRAAEQLDEVREVLVCELDEDCFLGRTKRQAPEVDGMVHLQNVKIGDIVDVKITETYCYELEGEVV